MMFMYLSLYNKYTISHLLGIYLNIQYLLSKSILYCSLGDLFENYCRNDDLVTFGRFCYGVTVILTYPIECFVTREVSTVSFNTLARSFLYYINLAQFINHLILQIPKCMIRNIIHVIFSFTQFKDNSYSNVYELFFSKVG